MLNNDVLFYQCVKMVNKISSVSTVVQLSSQLVGGAFACNFHNFQ